MSSGIVYNQTWEDPFVDQEALKITPEDIVLTVSSAGCNVLNLALLKPKKVFAIDNNVSQNQLLRLKITAALNLDYDEFWDFFGIGASANNLIKYDQKLRKYLDSNSRVFWDKNISIFKTGLYNEGRLASLNILRMCIYVLCGKQNILTFLKLTNLEDQKKFYLSHLKDKLWNILTKYIPIPTMIIYGVHPQQISLSLKAKNYFLKDIFENRLDFIFTAIPIKKNYFWQRVLGGRYVSNYPPYLEKSEYGRLKEVVKNIEIKDCTILDFLKEQKDNSISKFNLLDVPEFIPSNNQKEMWDEVYRVAKNNAILIYRSFSPNFPLKTSMTKGFLYLENESIILSKKDMTGSYDSFYKYTITK